MLSQRGKLALGNILTTKDTPAAQAASLLTPSEKQDQLPSEVIPSKELPMIWWIPFLKYLPHAAAIWLTHDDRSSCPTTAGATGNPGVPREEPPAGSHQQEQARFFVLLTEGQWLTGKVKRLLRISTHSTKTRPICSSGDSLADTEMAGKKKRGHKTKSQSEEQRVASPGWRSPKRKPASQLQPS